MESKPDMGMPGEKELMAEAEKMFFLDKNKHVEGDNKTFTLKLACVYDGRVHIKYINCTSVRCKKGSEKLTKFWVCEKDGNWFYGEKTVKQGGQIFTNKTFEDAMEFVRKTPELDFAIKYMQGTSAVPMTPSRAPTPMVQNDQSGQMDQPPTMTGGRRRSRRGSRKSIKKPSVKKTSRRGSRKSRRARRTYDD